MKRRMRSALNRTHSLLKVLVLACLVLTFLCRLVLSRTREARVGSSYGIAWSCAEGTWQKEREPRVCVCVCVAA